MTTEQLEEKIKTLEARVKELEARPITPVIHNHWHTNPPQINIQPGIPLPPPMYPFQTPGMPYGTPPVWC